MKDKLQFLLFILFLALSVYFYDQYVTNQGDVGPIAKTVRWLNLEQTQEDSKIVQKAAAVTFEHRLKDRFVALKEKLDFVAEQKMKSSEKRKEIFRQLIALNDQIKQVVNLYQQEIARQRQFYITENDELAQLALDLIETHKLKDDVSKRNQYREVESRLIQIINQVVQGSQGDTNRIKDILFSVEQIVMEDSGLFVGGCDNFEGCLQKRFIEINQELTKIFEPVLKDAGRKMEVIEELADYSEEEYLWQLDNIDVIEQQEIQIGRKALKKEGRLIKRMIKITKNDLQDLIYLYKEINIDYRRLFTQWDAGQNRWDENSRQIHGAMEQVIEGMRFSNEVDFNPLIEKFNEVRKVRDVLLAELNVNDEQFSQMLKHCLFEHNDFFTDICDRMKISLKRLVSEVGYADHVNRRYVPMRMKMRQQK